MADHQADGEAATSPQVNENSVSAQLRKVEEEIIAQRKMIVRASSLQDRTTLVVVMIGNSK